MSDTAFDTHITTLLGDTQPRVWSWLVTMFGDLALRDGDRMSGGCVSALTATIGIKPEATRVALHRLRKDGWIDSLRVGRQSFYGLTNHGRAETLAAHPTVYATSGPTERAWLMIRDPAATGDADFTDDIQIAPHISVTKRFSASGEIWIQPLSDTAVPPQWISDKMCPPEKQVASRRLAGALGSIAETLNVSHLTALQKTALRVSVVHEWRRLILRVPALPDHLFSDRWHGPDCRQRVASILASLPAPSLDTLEADVTGKP